MLPRGMKDDSGKINEQDSDFFHDDEGRKHQDDFSVDVRNLVDTLRSRGNPFLEAGVDLVNLDGRISNAKDVSAIYDKGKDQYDQFVNDVIVTRNTPLESPIGSVRSGYPIEGAAALGFRYAFCAVHRA